jgi:hypothetical protein
MSSFIRDPNVIYTDDPQFLEDYEYYYGGDSNCDDGCNYNEEDVSWSEDDVDAHEEELIYLAELKQFEDTYYPHVYNLLDTGKFTYVTYNWTRDGDVKSSEVYELSYFAKRLNMTVENFRAAIRYPDTKYSVAKMVERIVIMYRDGP